MSFKHPPHQATSLGPEVALIIAANVPHRADRLKVSPGVVAADSESLSKYSSGAHVHRLQFGMDGIESLLDLNLGSFERNRTLGIIRISDCLLESLREGARCFSQPSDLAGYIDAVCSEVPSPWKVHSIPPRLVLGRNLPGLRTV